MDSLVPIEILSISNSLTNKNSYNIIMKEIGGIRRFHIIVGVNEAQILVIAMEKLNTSRPFTHMLTYNILTEFNISLEKVIIYKYEEGVFFANLFIYDNNSQKVEIDSRPSDALTLSLIFSKPIFIDENILNSVCLEKYKLNKQKENNYDSWTIAEINKAIEIAIFEENFELAAKLKVEIAKRKNKK